MVRQSLAAFQGGRSVVVESLQDVGAGSGPARGTGRHLACRTVNAAWLGMTCPILLEDRTRSQDPNCRINGNVLLDHPHGATTEGRPSGLDMNAELGAAAAALRATGRRVYAIPGGGSNPTGALGCVNCAFELVGQANDAGLVVDRLVTATGRAGIHAGLVVGLKAINAGTPILGFGVRAPKERQEEMVFTSAQRTAQKLGCPGVVARQDVVADTDYVGEGYGIPRADTIEAIRMFAGLGAILLDPVCSGKGTAGSIDHAHKGRLKGRRVVFLHIGGTAALFGYDAAFADGHRKAGPAGRPAAP